MLPIKPIFLFLLCVSNISFSKGDNPDSLLVEKIVNQPDTVFLSLFEKAGFHVETDSSKLAFRTKLEFIEDWAVDLESRLNDSGKLIYLSDSSLFTGVVFRSFEASKKSIICHQFIYFENGAFLTDTVLITNINDSNVRTDARIDNRHTQWIYNRFGDEALYRGYKSNLGNRYYEFYTNGDTLTKSITTDDLIVRVSFDQNQDTVSYQKTDTIIDFNYFKDDDENRTYINRTLDGLKYESVSYNWRMDTIFYQKKDSINVDTYILNPDKSETYEHHGFQNDGRNISYIYTLSREGDTLEVCNGLNGALHGYNLNTLQIADNVSIQVRTSYNKGVLKKILNGNILYLDHRYAQINQDQFIDLIYSSGSYDHLEFLYFLTEPVLIDDNYYLWVAVPINNWKIEQEWPRIMKKVNKIVKKSKK